METLLRQLCEVPGVGGQKAASTRAAELLSGVADTVTVDALGSVIATRKAADPAAPTLLLEAHLDQVGFLVTRVDDKGFVRVAPCGGADRRTLPAAAVTVWGKSPCVGVFGSVPPHLSKDGTVPEIPDLGIDVGLSADEARAQIRPGDAVSFAPRFDRLLGSRICAGALDDRAGCAAVIDALRKLKDTPLPCSVTAVLAVREEVGGHGAAAAAFGVRPAAALITDVSFALTPDAAPNECGVLGEGVMLGYSPLLSAPLTRRLADIAKARHIPVQPEVMGGKTGTDADRITAAGAGVPCALLSIPLRYMHTPAEVADLTDIQAVSDLMAAFVTEGGAALC